MPAERVEEMFLSLPPGVLRQFANQLALDVQASIALALSAERASGKRANAIDEVARPVIKYLKEAKSDFRHRRVAPARSTLWTTGLVEHARRYRLTGGERPPAPRGAPELAAAYGWAAEELSEHTFLEAFRRFPRVGPPPPPEILPSRKAPPFVGVEFRVHKVLCVDETGREPFGEYGNDEIRMAATTIDTNAATVKVPAFKVKDFASDGDAMTYSPPKVIHAFNIGAGWPFPQANVVYLHLAEADSGGFGTFLNELFLAVKDTVVKTLVGAGAAIGLQYGASLGSVGGPIGTVLGAVVGAIIGAVIGWLVGALKDDIFESQAAAIQIPSATENFGGSDSSPVSMLIFKGHNGQYNVSYDWLLKR